MRVCAGNVPAACQRTFGELNLELIVRPTSPRDPEWRHHIDRQSAGKHVPLGAPALMPDAWLEGRPWRRTQRRPQRANRGQRHPEVSAAARTRVASGHAKATGNRGVGARDRLVALERGFRAG